MDQESINRYKQGAEVWNTWATEMLAQRTKLTEAGEWRAKINSSTGKLRGENKATERWLAASTSDFSGETFSPAVDFTNLVFPGDADFSRTTFINEALFTEVTFSGQAEFSNANFKDNVLFQNTTFAGEAWFEAATFTREAWFDNALFTGEAWFNKALFKSEMWFHGTTFESDVKFNQAIFEGHTSFFRAVFKKDPNFIAMRGQSFFTLEETTFFLVPNFEQAHFAEAPRLDNSYFGVQPQFWGQRPLTEKTNVTDRWRTLKRLAVQGHDHERELNFLAEEIKSLRGVQDFLLPNPLRLGKNKSIWPGGGRYWAGLFYQWFSNFGRSTARPLLSWAVMTAIFAFYFHYLSPHSGLDSNSPLITTFCSSSPATAALYLSVNNGLVISGLGRNEKLAQSYACLYGRDGKDRISPIMPDAVMFAGLAQTILSAILIFLFLLALRNYFRIK